MVNPARIRHRIERIEVDETNTRYSGDVVFVDFYCGQKPKWYLGFGLDDRVFYMHRPAEDFEPVRSTHSTGRLRDYLVSILPPEIMARCIAAAIAYRGGGDGLPW